MSDSLKRNWQRAILILVAAGVVFGLFRLVQNQGDQLAENLGRTNPVQLILPLAVAALAMTGIAFGWHQLLTGPGRPGIAQSTSWYFIGELGKYIPGGVWPLVGRAELAAKGGVPRSLAYGSVGQSLILLYGVAGVPAASLIIVGDTATLRAVGWVSAGLAVASVALFTPLGTESANKVLGRVTGQSRFFTPLAPSAAGKLFASYLGVWLAIGSATWLVAGALQIEVGFLPMVAATIVSWVGGFAAVPVPSGLGVREAILTLLLSNLDPADVVAIALVARLLFVVVDVAGALVSVAFRNRFGSPGFQATQGASDVG